MKTPSTIPSPGPDNSEVTEGTANMRADAHLARVIDIRRKRSLNRLRSIGHEPRPPHLRPAA
jgi:hypothetical protein